MKIISIYRELNADQGYNQKGIFCKRITKKLLQKYFQEL